MRDGMHGSTQLTDPGRPARLAALVAALTTVVVLIAAPTAQAGSRPPDGFPAAGELLVNTVSVRARPDPGSRVVRRLTRLRPTFQVQVILALRQRLGSDGFVWYQLSLPGRPNGQRGWVRAAQVDVRPVANRIVVSIRRRVLEVRRVTNGRVLLRTVVAVGSPAAPTPRGRNFFVRSGFVPLEPFYGSYALETSAYASLSDWPGGGIVGIHGTNQPQLLGQAVSHGCVRVANSAALRLRRLAPPGTPIDIIR